MTLNVLPGREYDFVGRQARHRKSAMLAIAERTARRTQLKGTALRNKRNLMKDTMTSGNTQRDSLHTLLFRRYTLS
jgi:hypothetical protein